MFMTRLSAEEFAAHHAAVADGAPADHTITRFGVTLEIWDNGYGVLLYRCTDRSGAVRFLHCE